MTEFRPDDQPARDHIASSLGETIFVEAGAGSGKTTALVGRILELLKAGECTVQQLAAITFTEKAAGELRERLRERIEIATTDSSGPVRERLERASIDIDRAAIGTIHGFCSRILSEFPLDVGLPPGFKVFDAVEEAIDFERRWDALVETLASDHPKAMPYFDRAQQLGATPEHFRQLASAMAARYDKLPGEDREPEPLTHCGFGDILAQLADVCLERSSCKTEEDLLYKHLHMLAETLDGAEFLDDEASMELARGLKASFGRGQAANWTNPKKEEIAERLKRIETDRNERLARIGSNALSGIVSFLCDWTRSGAADRKRAGTLVFHDLLVFTRDLLHNSQRIRHQMHERFERIFVDEFQDTDPLQVEVVYLIAGDSQADPPPEWVDSTVSPGRLFFVGDPKQSIYGFRGADIARYEAVRGASHHRGGAGHVSLTHNFRSVVPIIDWVNEIFKSLMAPGSDDAAHVAFERLTAHLPHDREGHAVMVIGGPDGTGQAVDALRAVEGEDIVKAVRYARAVGWAKKLSDIALLIPTRTAWPVYDRAFQDAGIPVRMEARSLIYATQDIRDLTESLRAIADPSDEVALVAALKSPLFGCSDQDLLEWRAAGGRWNFLRNSPVEVAADHPVRTAFDDLHGYQARQRELSVSALLAALISERRLMEIATTARRPRDRWARIAFFQDQARVFDDGGGRSVLAFLEFIDRQTEARAQADEQPVEESDDDAVRILTIHASKGLEFPVVILAGLNGHESKKRAKLLTSDCGIEVRLGDEDGICTSDGYGALSEAQRSREFAETIRLLYVAATRAKERLILSLWHQGNTSCLAKTLHAECEKQTGLCGSLRFDDLPDAPGPEPDGLCGGTTPQRRQSWIETRKDLLTRTARMPVIAATAYAHAAARTAAPFRKRTSRGTQVGRAVHAVLESIDLNAPGDIGSACRAQADAEQVLDEVAEIERAVRAALKSDTVRHAAASEGTFREVYIGAPIGPNLLEGFVDLLYRTPDGLVIVDYKTDLLASSRDVDEAFQRYTRQGAAYAVAVEAVLGERVAACKFLFLRARPAPEMREIADLPAAMSLARAELESAELFDMTADDEDASPLELAPT